MGRIFVLMVCGVLVACTSQPKPFVGGAEVSPSPGFVDCVNRGDCE